MYAITTKKVLKKKGFAQTRTAAIADGNYPMSYCPFQLADSTIVAELFIVATDNTNFATWLKKPPTGSKSMNHEFLPGIALDFFDRQNIGIYASPGGVMTTEIFEKAIKCSCARHHAVIDADTAWQGSDCSFLAPARRIGGGPALYCL